MTLAAVHCLKRLGVFGYRMDDAIPFEDPVSPKTRDVVGLRRTLARSLHRRADVDGLLLNPDGCLSSRVRGRRIRVPEVLENPGVNRDA